MLPAVVTVQTGDTLSGLAQQYLGSAASWPVLYQENEAVVGPDPNLIFAGETLYVGRHRAPAPPPAPASTASVTAPGPVLAVPVSPGQGTLVSIARYLEDHGATPAAAAGIAGDIDGESLGDPESAGDGGFGLIGWTGNTIGLPPGYTGPTGNYAADLAAQESGVVGYVGALGGFGPINAAGSVAGAGDVFSAQYEKPADRYSDVRFSVAEDIYAALG
jgi:hypothetical protein